MDDMSIQFRDSSVVVNSEPKVVSLGHVKYVIGDQVVGSVDATFDLTNLPPELHSSFLAHIQRVRVSIGGVAHLYWPDKYMDPVTARYRERLRESEARAALPWWRRWFS